MKGYSRIKQDQAQAELAQKQQEFEAQVAHARQRQLAIVRETEHLRKIHQLTEAKKRLEEVQRVQEEQLKRRDQRDRYVQAMRMQHSALNRTESRERTVQALDLEIAPSRIPTVSRAKDLPHLAIPGESRIPGIRKPQKPPEVLWEKGDLLDSLDLSSTKMKEKLGHLHEKLKQETEEKRETENDAAWLGKSIRQSIKEWAPVLSDNRGAPVSTVQTQQKPTVQIQEKPIVPTQQKPIIHIQEKPTVQTQQKPIIQTPEKPIIPQIPLKSSDPAQTPVPKPSKKVAEIRGRVQRNRVAEDGFLTQELQCIEEEEKRMLESIDRLDAELVGVKLEHVVEYTSKPRPRNINPAQEETLVQESVAKLSEILERRSEAGTDCGSVYSGPTSVYSGVGSIYSAPTGPTTKIKSKPYAERLLTKVTIEDLKRERTHSSDSARKTDESAKKPQSYAAIKAREKAPVPTGKPPVPRVKSTHRVEVNPRVDLKAIFEDDDQDLPPWAD